MYTLKYSRYREAWLKTRDNNNNKNIDHGDSKTVKYHKVKTYFKV